jgi:hypothetical protein
VREGEHEPPPFSVSLWLHPSIRVEPVWIRKYVGIVPVYRVRLAANDCALGDEIPVDVSPILRDMARERHGNGGEAAQAFLDDGVKEWKLVKVGIPVCPELFLEVLHDVG